MRMNSQVAGLHILLTNNSLAIRAGTELYIRDLAIALKGLGHEPVVFSTVLGPIADELREQSVTVADDLSKINFTPDIIHAQHHYDAMIALLRFPAVPAVYFCCGTMPWQEAPLHFPTVVRYVAVDEPCRQRLINEGGIDTHLIDLLLNHVDMRRFTERAPLPGKPTQALVLSNTLTEANGIQHIRRACSGMGIRLEAAGLGVGNVTSRPNELMAASDIVFARGRTALEAMAVGCAVIVCDTQGMAGIVTSENLEWMRINNCGFNLMDRPLTTEVVAGEIARYSAEDAGKVSNHIRQTADFDSSVQQLIEIYRRAIIDFQQRDVTSLDELQAAARYLHAWAGRYKSERVVERVVINPFPERPSAATTLGRVHDLLVRGLVTYITGGPRAFIERLVQPLKWLPRLLQRPK